MYKIFIFNILIIVNSNVIGQSHYEQKTPLMMFGDTSRTVSPFSKDPHVINFKGRYLIYYCIIHKFD